MILIVQRRCEMITIDMQFLREVAHAIQQKIRTSHPILMRAAVGTMKDYHGFGKYEFKHILKNLPGFEDVDLGKIQAELIRVNSDLSNETHYHKESDAYVIFLGEEEHVPGAED